MEEGAAGSRVMTGMPEVFGGEAGKAGAVALPSGCEAKSGEGRGSRNTPSATAAAMPALAAAKR